MAERSREDIVRPGRSKRDMSGNREGFQTSSANIYRALCRVGGHRVKLGVALSIKSSKTGKQEITIECDKCHDRGM